MPGGVINLLVQGGKLKSDLNYLNNELTDS